MGCLAKTGFDRMINICAKTAFGFINKSQSSNIQLESSKFITLNKNDESSPLGSILTKLANQNSSISFGNKNPNQKANLKSARIILDGKVKPNEIQEDFVIIKNEQCLKGDY